MIRLERLREVLAYDPETGVFTWRVSLNNRGVVGAQSGSAKGDGYLLVRVDKVLYQAHRLAWFYVHGTWPELQIDHINGDRGDNRITNLRDARSSIQNQNKRAATSRSKSGLLGVSREGNRFRADIGVNRKRIYLGRFDSAEEAHAAYLSAKRRLHPGCTI